MTMLNRRCGSARGCLVWVGVACGLLAGHVGAQIPPPQGPVTFCGTQALPAATSYELSVDGGSFVPVTMAAVKDVRCSAASTHSFTVAASVLTVGAHSVAIRGTNAFGVTLGPTFAVTVGIAPGTYTINAVLP